MMPVDLYKTVILLVGAIALDWLIGDPRWIPHPANGIAALARRLEKISKRWDLNAALGGLFTAAIVYLVAFGSAYVLTELAERLYGGLDLFISIWLIASTVAARGLVSHANRVLIALQANDLSLAQERVSWMVGRDTAVLDETGVVKAVVESVSESLTDGIISPLFYAALGGLLGGAAGAAGLAMLYRSANTLDSLFGYRTEQYLVFGKTSARVDDVLNYLPARISAFCIVLAALATRRDAKRAFRIWRRDARKHKSPNAGRTEAAIAGALGIQLGGPAWYENQWKDHACLGDPVRKPVMDHIKQACFLVGVAEILFVLMISSVVCCL